MVRSSQRGSAVAVTLLLGLTGCGLTGAAAEQPPVGTHGTTTQAEEPPAPVDPFAGVTVEQVRAEGTPAVLGDVTVHVLAVDLDLELVDEPASVLLTARAPAVPAPEATAGAAPRPTASAGTGALTRGAVVALPDGSTATALEDGSTVVHDVDGAFLLGLSRPVRPAAPGGGQDSAAGHPRLEQPTTGLLVLGVPADGAGVSTWLGADAVAGTEWGKREGGRSLAVVPTDWARAAGMAGEQAVWEQLVLAVPEIDLPVMRDQLTCHALGAPDKAEWNLEPWRPDVGLLGVLAAGCNPT